MTSEEKGEAIVDAMFAAIKKMNGYDYRLMAYKYRQLNKKDLLKELPNDFERKAYRNKDKEEIIKRIMGDNYVKENN